MTPLEEKIIDLMKEQMSDEKVNLTTKFFDDLGGDSLDLVEFAILLEEVFDIEISDEEAEDLNNATVMDWVNLLRKKGVQSDGQSKECPCCGAIS